MLQLNPTSVYTAYKESLALERLQPMGLEWQCFYLSPRNTQRKANYIQKVLSVEGSVGQCRKNNG